MNILKKVASLGGGGVGFVWGRLFLGLGFFHNYELLNCITFSLALSEWYRAWRISQKGFIGHISIAISERRYNAKMPNGLLKKKKITYKEQRHNNFFKKNMNHKHRFTLLLKKKS